MTPARPRLRVREPTRWDLLSGRIHWHSTCPSGPVVECGRGASFGRCRSHRDPLRSSLRGRSRQMGRRSQTGPKHPAFPRRSGRGTPKRFGPPGETSSRTHWASAERAAASERVDPKPKGASSERASATSRASQRTPRWRKALRSAGRARARGDTRTGRARNGEKAHQPVNAIASERTRRGDGMVAGYRGGERFEGSSPQGTTPGWTVRSTTFGSALGRETEQGVRNVVNPMAGCGVQQTRRPSNEWVFGSARCGGNR